MSRWDHRYLGHERFPETLSTLEIEHFFTLSENELALVRERRRSLNRLALALQIGFLKMTGGTLNSVEIIPAAVLDHLGHQLACPPPRIAPRSEPSIAAAARCSTIRRRRSGCLIVLSSHRMPNGGSWPISAGKRRPCSIMPSSWRGPARGWSSITISFAASATSGAL